MNTRLGQQKKSETGPRSALVLTCLGIGLWLGFPVLSEPVSVPIVTESSPCGEELAALIAQDIASLMAMKKDSVPEQSLQDLRSLAETAERSKRAFLAGLNHEWRNPLSTILLATQMLSQTQGRLDKDRGYIKIIQGATHSLRQLLESLMGLSDLEAEQSLLQFEALSARQLVKDALDEVRPLLESKSLNIVTGHTLDHPGFRPLVYGDALRLRQTLTILFQNAVYYSPKGAEIEWQLRSVGDEIHFHVRDQGQTIESRLSARPLENTNRNHPTSWSSHGVPLWIAQRLIEWHGGRVWYESAAGENAYSFSLPLPPSARTNAPFVELSKNKNRPDPSREILIIDDNLANLTLAEHFLKDAGFSVMTKESAAEGLVHALQHPPALFLVDINMPGISGIDMKLFLQGHPRLRGIPVVAYTICQKPGDEELFRAVGFNGYIPKPISRDTFVADILAYSQPRSQCSDARD